MARKGLTLLELMVVIAVVAVLLSLLAPALLSAREVAREKECLATLRGVGQATHIWANDHNGFFPHLGTPGQLGETVIDQNTGLAVEWLDNWWSWTVSMRGYLDAAQRICPWHPTHESPLFDENSTGSNYALSSALYTNWAVWKALEPADTVAQLRPVRISEVAHPANKAMFVEFIPYHLAGFDFEAFTVVNLSGGWARVRYGVTTVLVDGSARAPQTDTLFPGPILPPALRPGSEDVGGLVYPLVSTVDGFLGRDF